MGSNPIRATLGIIADTVQASKEDKGVARRLTAELSKIYLILARSSAILWGVMNLRSLSPSLDACDLAQASYFLNPSAVYVAA